MNTAKNILTGEILYGRVLKEMDETIVAEAKFVCEYCSVALIACSYKKIKKGTSYFKNSEEYVLLFPHKKNVYKSNKVKSTYSLANESMLFKHLLKIESESVNSLLKLLLYNRQISTQKNSIN